MLLHSEPAPKGNGDGFLRPKTYGFVLSPKGNGHFGPSGLSFAFRSELAPDRRELANAGPKASFMAQLRKVVAVVDDDESMLRGLQRLLNASGFDTEGFSSAEAFLRGATASKATCLVLDIHLQGISGIELRRQLSKSGSTLAVIYMTAVDDESVRSEAMESGCVTLLRKPFLARELVEAIALAIRTATPDC